MSASWERDGVGARPVNEVADEAHADGVHQAVYRTLRLHAICSTSKEETPRLLIVGLNYLRHAKFIH